MVTVVAKEIYQDWRTNAERVMETHTVTAETLAEAFKKAYPYERSLRYCTDHFIRYEDENGNSLKEEYAAWKKTGLTIDLYYGGGVVD